ncbi:transglutaminase family protein [Bacteroidota bacterium]
MRFIVITLLFLTTISLSQTNYGDINFMIDSGDFTKAQNMIDKLVSEKNLNEREVLELKFQREKLDRIKLDFRKTEDEVLSYIQKYIPEANKTDLLKWEKDGYLEYKIIDSVKYYFNRAHTNFFRINKEAKKIKIAAEGNRKDNLDLFLEKYVPNIIEAAKFEGSGLVKPVNIKLNYRLIVNPDIVPTGEIIRCWLPYPREGHARQSNVELLKVNSHEYVIADNKHLQRTLYIEKIAKEGEPTIFNYELKYTASNEYFNLDSNNIIEYNVNSDVYKNYISEVEPHIVYSEKIKKLSKTIIQNETIPYLKAKKIYKWINDNIPWAGAREYSTLLNISDYCLSKGYGDCGIQTLTFITLCRYNGIPAKWQSGWMLHPGSVNLHDWCELYFEGIGWIPVDQSFGLLDCDKEEVKWFFLGGIDAYHLIINDGYSEPLYPAKIYPRSETVDFQRGEVEWRGGNLYFNDWDYFMEVEYF